MGSWETPSINQTLDTKPEIPNPKPQTGAIGALQPQRMSRAFTDAAMNLVAFSNQTESGQKANRLGVGFPSAKLGGWGGACVGGPVESESGVHIILRTG